MTDSRLVALAKIPDTREVWACSEWVLSLSWRGTEGPQDQAEG